MSLKTPLYDAHVQAGGKMADFAGWLMPLWYKTGQSAEHHATRNACGLFDICHMGEFDIEGKESLPFLSHLLSNNVEKIEDGQAMYHFLLNPEGGVIDDCILYRFSEEKWMLVVNAANMQTDLDWLNSHVPSGVSIKNISDQIAKIDLQGPLAPKLLSTWVDQETLSGLKFFRFLENADIDGMQVLVSRTGYTGEVGFELYTSAKHAVDLWNTMLEEGQSFGCLPCGLGARDTLRVEAGLPLHGHELLPDRPAIGHPWMFSLDFETEFIGKKALLDAMQSGRYVHVLPFKIHGPRKALPGWKVLQHNNEVGEVLSGVISPTLNNQPIGFFLSDVPIDAGRPLMFEKEGGAAQLKGEVANLPFTALTSRKKMSVFLD